MNRCAVMLLALCWPALAQAQPIHGHSQKAAYASPTEYPRPSAQCHWNEPLPPAAPDGSNSQAIIDAALLGSAHIHFDPVTPFYSEVTGLIRSAFTIKLFQTGGTATFDLDRQETVTKIEWDDVGELPRRVLTGDPAPHAVRQWTGHFTIDPRRNVGGHGFPSRGWYSPQIEIGFAPNTHVEILQLVKPAFYSMLDPSAPDGSLSGAPVVIASCYPHSPKITEWGTNYVEADTMLPLAPISAPWPIAMGTASYGSTSGVIGLGFFEHRIDFDFHNSVPGKILQHLDEQNFISANRAPVLDPAVIGPGPHANAFIWSKPTTDRSENITALLVWPIEVSAGTPPPPPLCQDPKASNLGKPLPCVFDTPPPPTDLCPNIPDVQTTIPAGLIVVNGQCVAPPPVCTPPAVLVNGQCVTPTPPPTTPAGTYTYVCDAAGNCKLTFVPKP